MSASTLAEKAPSTGAFSLLPPAERGFSLVELVAVLVIIGVLATVAVPRFLDSPLAGRGYAEEVAAALRYSHNIAVASGCAVRFSIDQFGYTAMQDSAAGAPFPNHCGTTNAWTTAVRRTDGTTVAGVPPTDVLIAGMPPAVVQIVFDAQGAVAGAVAPLNIAGSVVTVLPSGQVQGP